MVSALEKGKVGIGFCINFRIAFDTVSRRILLGKLSYYGIRGIAHKFFCSYLFIRKQFVEYDYVKSSLLRVQYSVLQGSILGPLILLLQMNATSFVR